MKKSSEEIRAPSVSDPTKSPISIEIVSRKGRRQPKLCHPRIPRRSQASWDESFGIRRMNVHSILLAQGPLPSFTIDTLKGGKIWWRKRGEFSTPKSRVWRRPKGKIQAFQHVGQTESPNRREWIRYLRKSRTSKKTADLVTNAEIPWLFLL